MSVFGIMACDQKGGIGKDGGLPWPTMHRDMEHFKHITKGKTVMMGRKTWDSLPESVRPLPGRKNIVITKGVDNHMHGMDINAALDFLEEISDDVFIMGGGEIYKALESKIDYWYLTIITGDYKCDTKFAPALQDFELVGEITCVDSSIPISFKEYRRKTTPSNRVLPNG